jgi:translation initiation factor 3 subunit D
VTNSTNRIQFHNLPYAPFGRSDRLGRSADFTTSQDGINASALSMNLTGAALHRQRMMERRMNDTSRSNAEFQYKVQADDFELVDSNITSGGGGGVNGGATGGLYTNAGGKKSSFSTLKQKSNASRLRQINARGGGTAGGRGSGNNSYNSQFVRTRKYNSSQPNSGGGGYYRDRIDRQASVAIQSDWNLVMEMDLNKQVSKGVGNATTLPKTEDLMWCGFLDMYNDAYEKCSTRTPAVLKRCENKEFYPVTTIDDPVIEKLAVENKGNVFITDAILSHLMTCPRSVYPWDIVIQKLPTGTLFFDKRDSSQFDYLTVNETAISTPSPNKAEDDPEGINTPERLSLEATMIHQNFTQQIVRSAGGTQHRKNFEYGNPFWESEDDHAPNTEPASVGYRYRKFELGDGVDLICRTELHGYVKRNTTSSSTNENLQYMTSFALNEYFDSSSSSSNPSHHSNASSNNMNWREKLDSQRGAVLATEMKNNSFKLAKWTAQSLLAEAELMKIGFVSRTSPKNPYEHLIVGTQFYNPKDFATQLSMNYGSMWGIVRMLIGVFRDQKEGKYVLMRDPNRAVLKVYAVPPGTFEEEEEGDDEEKE